MQLIPFLCQDNLFSSFALIREIRIIINLGGFAPLRWLSLDICVIRVVRDQNSSIPAQTPIRPFRAMTLIWSPA
jgi:hypothetical protein